MSSVINTNSLSLLTQNNLNASQSSLNTAIQRLSSGLRINSAKDDAAGQAIANRFTANIRGLTQASRNANDGISLAQTTEGALTEVTNNLQRVRELTVQAANGSNSANDLKSIQDEITQRLSEIDRISSQTDFNGVKVLSSSAKALSVQVGANDGETISIGLREISSKTLNLAGFNVDGTGAANTAASSKDLLAAGYAAGATTNGTTAYSKTYGAADAASLSNVLGRAVSGTTVVDAGQASIAKYTSNGTSYDFNDTARTGAKVSADLKPAAGGSTAVTITIGGTSVNANIDSNGMLTSASTGNKLYLDGASGNLTENSGGTLPQANVNGGGTLASGDLLYSMGNSASATKTGGTIVSGSGASATTYTYAVGGNAAETANVTNAHISSSALATQVGASNGANAITVDLDGAGGAAAYIAAAGTGAVTQGGLAVSVDMNNALTTNTAETLYVHSNGNVTDSASNMVYNDSDNAGKFTLKDHGAATATVDPLKALDAALSNVDKLRSSLGAVQNRFDSTIANLGTTVTNLSSSRSRIQDADYAVEVSNMTRAQILQQAGTSVLAQANQTTQGVLKLLG